MSRKHVPNSAVVAVLTEAGYRCAVPTCRTILAIDLHHMHEVAEGGGNDPSNLIALCPTCHALYHRGIITRDSIYAWKSMLMTLSRAFDLETIDQLLFLRRLQPKQLMISGDGVLKFARLIAAELAVFNLVKQNGPLFSYEVALTERGRNITDAWASGNRPSLTAALTRFEPSSIPPGGQPGQMLQRAADGSLVWDWARFPF
jgi:hypothetical protein